MGEFNLTIDKGSADTILSLCREGLPKTGPTIFQWSATNHVPTQDLKLLFVPKSARR